MKDTEKTLSLTNRRRFGLVMALLAALLLLGIALNVSIGSVAIAVGDTFSILAKGVGKGIADLFDGGHRLQQFISSATEIQILFRIRLPRMLLAMVLGGALSVSGYLLQVFFRNPIAGPFVLGISSGAKMAVGVTLIFLAPMLGGLSSVSLILAAFAGAMVITVLVLALSQRVRSMSMLLVIGIMVGYICTAVTDLCITFANEHEVLNLTNWSMGSFSGADWGDLHTALAVCLPCVLAAMLLSKPLGAYALGEGYASSMGVPVKAVRAAMILVSSLLSACVTALAGPISFVGIAVPHITRSLLRSAKPSIVIPASFICGAVFCLFCDLIARTILAPTELSIGTVTSIFGAPIVITMMVKRQREREV